MYDALSSSYDRFVNWQSRLAYELPFIERKLESACRRACRVLDAACGTGMHAIALSKRGFSVVGADNSAGMIEEAVRNAAAQGVEANFVQAGFGSLAQILDIERKTEERFDALLCLGNSLPHTLSPAELADTLRDFNACLKPGGMLLVQNRNFDKVIREHSRWMEPQSYRENDREWVFLRFYDFDLDGLITFHIVTLYREGSGGWEQRLTSTRLMPLKQAQLAEALASAGFSRIDYYGDMQGNPFDPEKSENLIVTTYAGDQATE